MPTLLPLAALLALAAGESNVHRDVRRQQALPGVHQYQQLGGAGSSGRLGTFNQLGGFGASRRPNFPTVNYPMYGITGDHSGPYGAPLFPSPRMPPNKSGYYPPLNQPPQPQQPFSIPRTLPSPPLQPMPNNRPRQPMPNNLPRQLMPNNMPQQPLIRTQRIGSGDNVRPAQIAQLEEAKARQALQLQQQQIQLVRQQQLLRAQQVQIQAQLERQQEQEQRVSAQLKLSRQPVMEEKLEEAQVPRSPYPQPIPVPQTAEPLMAQAMGVYLPGLHGGQPNYLTSAIDAARELRQLALTRPAEADEELAEYEYIYETEPGAGADYLMPPTTDVRSAQPELPWPQQPTPLTGIPDDVSDSEAYRRRGLSVHHQLQNRYNLHKSVRAKAAEAVTTAPVFQMDILPTDQVMAALLKQVESLHAVVYSRSDCEECGEVESLIQEYYQVPTTVFYLDSLNRGRELLSFIGEITNSTSVPKIFICGYFIGGYSEVMLLHKTNGLMRYIQKCFTPPPRNVKRAHPAKSEATTTTTTEAPKQELSRAAVFKHTIQVIHERQTQLDKAATPRAALKKTVKPENGGGSPQLHLKHIQQRRAQADSPNLE